LPSSPYHNLATDGKDIGADISVVQAATASAISGRRIDTAGVSITESGGSTAVVEGGATDSYTVVLSTQPTASVVLTVSPNSQVSVDKTTLTFTTSNWNVAQTVTVTAVDDTVAEGDHTGTISYTVASSDATYNGIGVSGVTASITDNETASISGYVWNDPNANGWDAGETKLSGWTVYLDGNGNRTLDSGEQSTVSASDGYYAFANLTAGTYTVREVVQSGWRQTYPSDNRPYILTVSAGQSLLYQSFGNQQVIGTASISGYVWNDPNANGWDAGETKLSGWTVFLDSNRNGTLDSGERSTVSASDGYYAFGSLPAGTYTVREVVQSGWRQTYPSDNRPYILTLSADQSLLYQSFGNQQLAVAVKAGAVSLPGLALLSDLAATAASLPSQTPSRRLELSDAAFAAPMDGEDWLYPIPLA